MVVSGLPVGAEPERVGELTGRRQMSATPIVGCAGPTDPEQRVERG